MGRVFVSFLGQLRVGVEGLVEETIREFNFTCSVRKDLKNQGWVELLM